MTFSVSKVIFDLDGTLVDTAPDLCSALNHCLKTQGLQMVDPAIVQNLVGQGAIAMLEKGLALQKTPTTLDPKSLHATFLDYYADHIADNSKTYEGCTELLEHLTQMDISLAICTNKPIKLAIPLMEELGIKHYFSAICGGDTFGFKKPDPRHITETAALLEGENSIVMIGDSIHDIEAAKAANIPTIGVSYGYSSIDMKVLKPTKIVDKLPEIKAHITR